MSTIRDVARAANVSIATVSRVTNGDPAVHPALRDAVQAAIRATGYRPNAAARSLRLARTGTVALVVSELNNPVFPAIVRGISAVAAARDVSLFLADSMSSYSAQGTHLDRLHERRVDGVIIYPFGQYAPQIQPLRDDGIPVVVIGQRASCGAPPEVLADEDEASSAAMRLLLDLGHRRIGFIARAFSTAHGNPNDAMRARLAVFRQAHADAGIPLDESLIAYVKDANEARTAVAALLARPVRPTAMIAGTHTDLPEALLAIREAGLRVPVDVSVISYGDSRWAEVHEPPVTVVRSDYQRFGESAARLLFAVIAGEEAAGTVHHRSNLVERGSCAPPTR